MIVNLSAGETALFLGIDIGTSGVKAVMLDANSRVLGSANAPLTVQRPFPLWSEQNPVDWWTAVQMAVLDLPRQLRSATRAIGLAGQMHGATLLGEDDQVLRPAILWNDGRSVEECETLESAAPQLIHITGNRAMPGFTAPKLMWLRNHEPEIFKKVKKVLLPKDYIRLCMTGEYASDMSDSAGTLWMDVSARDWSDEILATTGLSRTHMPELFEGSEITGQLQADIAQAWGMDRVPVVAGGGDNAAGAVGSGVVQKGEGFLSLGTSGVIFIADDDFRPNPKGGVHTFCHALPNRWHQMSVMLSAASAVDWVSRICGYQSPSDLYEDAARAHRLSRQEVFLPYLSGERTPHNDPNAQGVFFGLTHGTDKARLAQAALEGVAFGFADGLEALRATGAEVKSLSVIGGGSQSEYWGEILASALDLSLVYRDSAANGPAYGAAQLARLGTTGEAVANVCKPPAIIKTIEPNRDFQETLRPRLELFRELYPLIKEKFKGNAA